MKENLGEVTVVAKNRFKDRHGRYLIGDRKNHRYYIVDKDKEKMLTVMDNRLIMVLVVLVLAGFAFDLVWGIVIAGVLLLIVEFYYYVKFLPSLRTIENVEVPQTMSSMRIMADEAGTSRNLLRGVVSIITALLLMLNLMLTVKDWSVVWHFEDMGQVILVFFSIAAVLFFIYLANISLAAYYRHKRG